MSKAVENLKALLFILKDVPEEQFNMNHWWLKDGMAFDDMRNERYKVANGPCGCPVGHMIQKGMLREDVIKAKEQFAGQFRGESDRHRRVFGQIDDALQIWNQTLTEFMFNQYSYPTFKKITKADVIKRIEFVLAEMEGKQHI